MRIPYSLIIAAIFALVSAQAMASQNMTLSSGHVLVDGRVVELVFTGAVPSAYDVPDWQPGALNNVHLTTNSGVALEEIGSIVTLDTVNNKLVWTARYLITDSAKVITIDAASVSVSGGAGLLQDASGNSTQGFTSFAIPNTSLVDANGFTSQKITRGTGGVNIYVSSTYGNDSNTFAQAQNPATPYKTIRNALKQMANNNMDGKGAALRLLRGDTFVENASLPVSGQDHTHPFVMEDYWYSYAPSAADPGTRPLIKIDMAVLTNVDTGLGLGVAYLKHIIVRNIALATANFSGAQSLYGIRIMQGASDLTYDNVSVDSFLNNLDAEARSTTGPISDITFLRVSSTNSFSNGGHTQGMFMDGVDGLLVSQSIFDNNGRVTPDHLTRDIFSQNLYLQYTNGPGMTTVWGNIIRGGGDYGVELRSGGVIAYNYFGRNPMGSFVDGPGGSQFKNYYELANDVSPTTLRGSGAAESVAYGKSIAQTMEGNIVVNAIGGSPFAFDVGDMSANGISHSLVRNNTSFLGGPLVFATSNPSANLPLDLNMYQNLIDSGAVATYQALGGPNQTPPGLFTADNNALWSTVAKPFLVDNSWFTLTQWQSLTQQDTHSLWKQPQVVNPTANIASYFATQGGPNTEAGVQSLIDSRGLHQWDGEFDMVKLYNYLASQYKPTNLPTVGSGMDNYYGAVNYTSSGTSSGGTSSGGTSSGGTSSGGTSSGGTSSGGTSSGGTSSGGTSSGGTSSGGTSSGGTSSGGTSSGGTSSGGTSSGGNPPPVTTIGAMRFDGAVKNARSGINVLMADLNGDGYKDVILSAPGENSVYVVWGGPNLPSTQYIISNLTTTASLIDGVHGIKITSTEGGGFGGSGSYTNNLRSVAVADMNGDGLPDLIVGAPGRSSIYVIYGKKSWPQVTTVNAAYLAGGGNAVNGYRLDGDVGFVGFGAGLVIADMNGDGIPDIVTISPFASYNGTQSGSALVAFGKRSGWATTQIGSLTWLNSGGTAKNGYRIDYSGQMGLNGFAVADINGDGKQDVIACSIDGNPAGKKQAGEVDIVYGKTPWPNSGATIVNDAFYTTNANGFRLEGYGAYANFCSSLAIGDVNGDGIPDLIVGEARKDNTKGYAAGSVFVLYGKAAAQWAGTQSVDTLAYLDQGGTAHNGYMLRGSDFAYEAFGSSVAVADINGDGKPDLVIGASAINSWAQLGQVFVVYGNVAGITDMQNVNATWLAGGGTALRGFIIQGENANDGFGSNLALGDANGDGRIDMLTNAANASPNSLTGAGSTYLIFGKAAGQWATSQSVTTLLK